MKSGDESPQFVQNGRGPKPLRHRARLTHSTSGPTMRRLSRNESLRDHFFAGDEVATGEGAALAAGDEAALDDGAGVPRGFAASGPAGRKPRLPGLLSMLAAKLLTIFASDSATSSRAAF